MNRILAIALVLAGSLTTMGVAAAPAAAQQPGVSAVLYEIVARHSGKCLDVQGSSTADKARIIQYTCHGGDNQRFWRISNGTGFDELIAQHSFKCVDVQGSSLDDNAAILQYTCHHGPNQRFLFRPTAGAFGQLVAQHSGKCIDVRFASTADSAEVIQHSCVSGATNEEFMFQPTR